MLASRSRDVADEPRVTLLCIPSAALWLLLDRETKLQVQSAWMESTTATLRLPAELFKSRQQLLATTVFLESYLTASKLKSIKSHTIEATELKYHVFKVFARLLTEDCAFSFELLADAFLLLPGAKTTLLPETRNWLRKSSGFGLSALRLYLDNASSLSNGSHPESYSKETVVLLESLIITSEIAEVIRSSRFYMAFVANSSDQPQSSDCQDLRQCIRFYSNAKVDESAQASPISSSDFSAQQAIRLLEARSVLPGLTLTESIQALATGLLKGVLQNSPEGRSSRPISSQQSKVEEPLRTNKSVTMSGSSVKSADANPISTEDAALKAKIVSLALDPDEDDADDTYDSQFAEEPNYSSTKEKDLDSFLFPIWHTNPALFERRSRKDSARLELQASLQLGPEVLEGWAIMLKRDTGRLERLKTSLPVFDGKQIELARSKWSDRRA